MSTAMSAVLAKVDPARFQRATDALRAGSYTVSLTHLAPALVTAFVANGRRSYTVSLTESGGFCSCPDYAFRGVTCKHMAALAVRLTQDGVTIPGGKQ